jgi:monoamine oxidase
MSEKIRSAIVVGGGVSGLAAAGALGRAGVDVTLLEARERLGGRILTVRPRGWEAPVELGPEFVHSGNAAFWRFLQRHRIAAKNVPPRHWLFREGTLRAVPDIEGTIEQVTGEIDARRMPGWSFADFMAGRGARFAPDARNLARGFVEGFQAAPPDRMSAAAIEGETLADEEQFVLPGGYERVVAALVRELPQQRVRVITGAVVRHVEWRRGEVRVRPVGRGAKPWVAQAAVVTLPVGVWQASGRAPGAVAFAPELRAKQKIVEKMGVGHVIRVQLRFAPKRFAALLPEMLRRRQRGGFGFIHSQVDGVPVWWALSSRPVVTGWAGGPAALALVSRPASAMVDRALRSLAQVWDRSVTDLRHAVADWQTHDWSSDPFSRGAYSFTAAGAEKAAERLREPVRDTLFFAGEATADGEEVGTVHGAHASGLRAAEEVLQALGA